MTTPSMSNSDSHLLSVVNEVDRFISQPEVKGKFHRHVDQFCQMVERYAEEYDRQEKPIRDYWQDDERIHEQFGNDPDGLSRAKAEVEKKHHRACRLKNFQDGPPEPGMVWSGFHWACSYLKGPMRDTFWIQQEPVNPLPWFGRLKDLLLGVASREPTEAEKLMCDYFLLAIVHDETLWRQGLQTARLIYRDQAWGGSWFRRDEFSWHVLHAVQYEQARLDRALEHVKADLPAGKPAETEQNAASKRDDGMPHIDIRNSNVIVGTVQAGRDLQITHQASILKSEGTEERNKGVLKRILKVIGGVIGFMARVFKWLRYFFG